MASSQEETDYSPITHKAVESFHQPHETLEADLPLAYLSDEAAALVNIIIANL